METKKDLSIINCIGTCLLAYFFSVPVHELFHLLTRIIYGDPLVCYSAGAVEAIASVLALKEGIVPPTANYKEADPECDLNYTPNVAVKADLTCAISTSLGFGGHNACIAFRKV